jgi:hypothetical protein
LFLIENGYCLFDEIKVREEDGLFQRQGVQFILLIAQISIVEEGETGRLGEGETGEAWGNMFVSGAT